jgi:hypothetical protein
MTHVKFPSREELVAAYRAMHSDEIVARLAAGGLTELARAVATAELAARRQAAVWREPAGEDFWSIESLERRFENVRNVLFWGTLVALLLFFAGYDIRSYLNGNIDFGDIAEQTGLILTTPLALEAILYPQSAAKWLGGAVGLVVVGAILVLVLGMWGFAHVGG